MARGLWGTGEVAEHLAGALIRLNIAVAVLNLFPVAPLDGREAWALFPRALATWRVRRTAPKPKARPSKRRSRPDEPIDLDAWRDKDR